MGFERPKSVLVVRVGAMGDVLHGLPAVWGLRARWPEIRIGWAVEPRWSALVRAVADRVHLVPTAGWKERPASWATLKSIAALRRELRAEAYDVCVDLQGSIRSAVIARMSGAGRVVGSARPRERQARAFYGERVVLTQEHVTAQAGELLAAGLGEPVDLAPVQALREEEAEEWAAQFGEGFVLICPTAGWGAKTWPAERFTEVKARLEAAGERVVMNCGSVVELVALTRRAAVVLGCDTGPVHLAASLGRPVVALFGPTDPARNGPGGFVHARVRVLRDPGSVTDHRRHDETEAGLLKITVEQVVEAVLEMKLG